MLHLLPLTLKIDLCSALVVFIFVDVNIAHLGNLQGTKEPLYNVFTAGFNGINFDFLFLLAL